jgi:hypothetical protein
MSTPYASAEIIPAREQTVAVRGKDALTRLPTLDEVPVPATTNRRGEVVIYSGVSFGAQRQSRKAYSSSSPVSDNGRSSSGPTPPQGKISGIEMFSDERAPGQVFARVMIIEPGSLEPKEALITPLLQVSPQDRGNMDREYGLNRLVERANVEVTKFFNGKGPIDSELRLREFKQYVTKQESLAFLFSNVMNKNKNSTFDMFSAYFSPGGAMQGVGVFVNTWL